MIFIFLFSKELSSEAGDLVDEKNNNPGFSAVKINLLQSADTF